MTVPTPTTFFPNLNIANFTEVNNPTLIDDQHGTNNAYDFSGAPTAPHLSSNEKPFNTGSTVTFSHAAWIRRGTKSSGTQIIMAQSPSTFVNAVFFLNIINTTLFACFSTSGSDFLDSAILAGERDWSDGAFRYITTTVDGAPTNDLNIYVDGIEAGSYFVQDRVFGASFTGLVASPADLTIGAFSNNSTNGFDGVVSRPKFWEDIELTAAEVLEDFNNEIAAIGGVPTFKSPVIGRVMDTIYPENGIIKRDLYKSP